MKPFARFLRLAHDAINQAERELEILWLERLREMEKRETELRDALLALLLLWPFDSRGRLERRGAGSRREIRQLRRRAERAVDQFEGALLETFSGSPSGWRSISQTASRSYFEATQHLHIYEAAARASQAASRFDLALLLEDGPRRPGPDLGDRPLLPGGTPGSPAETLEPDGFIELELPEDADAPVLEPEPLGPTEFEIEHDERVKKAVADLDALFRDYLDESAPNYAIRKAEELLEKATNLARVLDSDPELQAYLRELKAILLELVHGEAFDAELDDLVDLLEAALDNPEGNVRNRSRQVREKLRDLSYDPTVTRSQVVQEINGTARRNATRFASASPAGVKLNRGHMRLSVEAHGRAAFRQSLQKWADRKGATNFLLEYPVGRRESIAPTGAIAKHAHQLRSRDEWAEVYREAASARFSTGTSLLGLHPGDFTYLVPVPDRYLADARTYAKRTRGRLLAFLERRKRAA